MGYILFLEGSLDSDYMCLREFENKAITKLTTFSGRKVVADFPSSDTARSSSAGGFSLNTSLPLVVSSGSSGSLRLR